MPESTLSHPGSHVLAQALRQSGFAELPACAPGADGQALLDELLHRNVSALALASSLSRHFGLPLLDLDRCHESELLQLPGAASAGWPLLALHLGDGRRVLACSDPTARGLIERALFQAGGGFTPVVVEHDKLQRWLARWRTRQLPGGAESETDFDHAAGDAVHIARAAAAMPTPAAADADTPLLRLLQHLFDEAARLGASDLHLEPQPQGLRIRLRVDGQLRDIAQPPRELFGALVVRIKVLAQLDITRTRLPQDGRMRQRCGSREVDIRVSCVPTVHGEKIVLRLLDSGQHVPALDQLGYSAQQLRCVQHALGRGDGLVLLTGPTGSGKTLTLYAFLRWLDRTECNIATAEDPVEIVLPGINQMPIQDRIGLGFAEALRALLRQDPDILMVGEIRDAETAEIAVQAAQTGHLVLSTLHTGDAPSALARLRNIGVAPYKLAACLNLVCAQRLLRRLCPRCRARTQHNGPTLRAAGCDAAQLRRPWNAYRPIGCGDCGGTGYRGRFAVHQLMPIGDALRQLILDRASGSQLAACAGAAGMHSLRRAALDAVCRGLTALPEALAATPQP